MDIVEIKRNLTTTLREQMKVNGNKTESEPTANQATWVELVRNQVNSLRFGVIQIVVHDSRIVQIERTEKVRLDQKPFDS